MYEEDAENEYEIEGDDSQWRHLKGATERQKKKFNVNILLLGYCYTVCRPENLPDAPDLQFPHEPR